MVSTVCGKFKTIKFNHYYEHKTVLIKPQFFGVTCYQIAHLSVTVGTRFKDNDDWVDHFPHNISLQIYVAVKKSLSIS